jgi:hypothetical protein
MKIHFPCKILTKVKFFDKTLLFLLGGAFAEIIIPFLQILIF